MCTGMCDVYSVRVLMHQEARVGADVDRHSGGGVRETEQCAIFGQRLVTAHSGITKQGGTF